MDETLKKMEEAFKTLKENGKNTATGITDWLKNGKHSLFVCWIVNNYVLRCYCVMALLKRPLGFKSSVS